MDQTEVADLARRRGLSQATLDKFNVRLNGTGWLYDSKCMDNQTIATRWKSFYSTKDEAPESERERWQKYRWSPEKPETARYFYPPRVSLKNAIQEASNHLWIVGGDIGSMTMFEAGIPHVISCFGDSGIPDALPDDLRDWQVLFLHVVADRDGSGEKWAMRIKELVYPKLPDAIIKFYALPYPLEKSHGKDVNDYWLDQGKPEKFEDMLMSLPEWVLPEREPEVKQSRLHLDDDQEIPESLKAEIRFRLGVKEAYNNEGWSRKNVRCPFHDDKEPSATWNDEKSILHCHAGCGKSYLAKDLCDHFGIRMADYFEHEPTPLPKVIVDVAFKPTSPTPPTKRYSPPLSDFAQLTPAQIQEASSGRKWLDMYVNWAKRAGPLSPDIFYESMGLWTLSMAAARRMQIAIGGEVIFPNLYIFIIAPTTVYRKSTALNITRSLIEKAYLDFLLMPERSTPEALFDYLAGKMPPNMKELSENEQSHLRMGRVFAAQRALYIDEASGLLSEMKKDYNAGLTELLLEGYDGTKTLRKILKGAGLIAVEKMCLSVLAATTPVEWSRRMGIEERQNGFVARFAVVTPEHPPIYKDTEAEVEIPTDLIRGLRHYFVRVLPWDKRVVDENGMPRGLSPDDEVAPPPIINVEVAPEAMAQINKYRKALGFSMLAAAGGSVEEDKSGQYARLATMMIKVAMLLAAIDTYQGKVRIETRHVYAAQLICERWRESLHRLDIHIQQSKMESVDDRLVNFIRAAGAPGVTLRDIQRGCNTNGQNIDYMLKTLMDAGVVERFQRKTKGRPAIAYRLSSDTPDESLTKDFSKGVPDAV